MGSEMCIRDSLSSDYRELRGLVVGADQALDLVQLLGVRLAEGQPVSW